MTSSESLSASESESGNAIAGTYTQAATESLSITLSQAGTNAAGTYSLTETAGDPRTITASGNAVTGAYSQTIVGVQAYTLSQGIRKAAIRTRYSFFCFSILPAILLSAILLSLESGTPQSRAIIVQTLDHWQNDTDLAGIRDQAALEKLPTEELAPLTQLWAEVERLLRQTREGS